MDASEILESFLEGERVARRKDFHGALLFMELFDVCNTDALARVFVATKQTDG